MAASGSRGSLKPNDEDEYSLIRTCHETVHVPLPPAYIGSEGKGVKTLLESWKGQYVERLHGVLLGYDNLKFVDATGTIIDDQPFVHRDVVGEFQVFRPETGSIVRAYINRMSKSHVGCLVHDWINLAIFLPPNPSPELSRYLNMGQEILCKITSVYVYRHNALRLRGAITSECLQLMQETIAPMRTSYDDELVEYESNYGDVWNEGDGSDVDMDRTQELSYLDPDDDYSLASRGQLLSEDGSLGSIEPPQDPLPAEKPKKKRKVSEKKKRKQVDALGTQQESPCLDPVEDSPAVLLEEDSSLVPMEPPQEKPRKKKKAGEKKQQVDMPTTHSSDVTASQDSELSVSLFSDSGENETKKRKWKNDAEDDAPVAKRKKESKKKKKKSKEKETDERKKKKEKKRKTYIVDVNEDASTDSFCNDRLSVAETASIQDDAGSVVLKQEMTTPSKKHKKGHRKKLENGPLPDASLDSACSEVSLKAKKKKKKKEKD
ncbi:uncharacterized protein LOC144128522 [Amblyomma americanum]